MEKHIELKYRRDECRLCKTERKDKEEVGAKVFLYYRGRLVGFFTENLKFHLQMNKKEFKRSSDYYPSIIEDAVTKVEQQKEMFWSHKEG